MYLAIDPSHRSFHIDGHRSFDPRGHEPNLIKDCKTQNILRVNAEENLFELSNLC